MSEKITFRAVIEDPGGSGAFVTVPFDVEKVFDQKRVKIKASIDGVPYRGSLVRMGGEAHMLIILKSVREKIGKSFGDEVEISLEEDTEARVVAVPDELGRLFAQNPLAQACFQKLAYSHQKEYAQWISSAKQAVTREKRSAQAIRMLLEGKKLR